MRLTKDFLERCTSIAISETSTALTTAETLRLQFFQEPETTKKLLRNMFQKGTLKVIQETDNAIIEAVKPLLESNTMHPDLKRHMEARIRSFLDSTPLQKRSVTIANLSDSQHIKIRPYLHFKNNTFQPNAEEILNAAEVIKFKELPKITAFVSSYYGGSDVHVDIKLEEALNKTQQKRYEQLLTTIETIQKIREQIRDNKGIVYGFTTLAQFQEETLIWPMVKDTEYVTNWITHKKHDMEVAKYQREQDLKAKRELAAQKRKQQLQELKDNPKLTKPTPEYDTSLVKAMNTIARANRNNQGDTDGSN